METYDILLEAARQLYGDAGEEIVKSLSKETKEKALTNTAIATNAVGSVAGPAAFYSAIKHRKEGGIPRDLLDQYAKTSQQGNKSKLVRSTGKTAGRIVSSLNKPKNKKAALAATAAGAGLVTLQGINWGGDMISTKLLNDQKKAKQDKQVQKSATYDESTTSTLAQPPAVRKLKLVTGTTFAAANEAPKVLKKVEKKKKGVVWKGEISKMDTDKRQVFGWASIVEKDGKPVVDLQEDMMTLEEIEKAAYDYVVTSRKGGHQHQRNGNDPKHVSDMIESFLVTPEKKEQMGLPETMPNGWWVGFKVNDDETWQAVKDGKLKEFSIHGSGVRKSIEIED